MATIDAQARPPISIVLMQGSPEAQATVDVLVEDHPDLRVADHGTYWKITSTDHDLEVDLDRVQAEIGQPLSTAQWLVILTSFVGRVETTPRLFRVTSAITQMGPPPP
jgi:hypothetical protein